MTPDKTARSADPLQSFDARVWAAEFCRLFPGSDEELMIAWFANALMRGYDEASREWRPATPRLERVAAEAEALYEALKMLCVLIDRSAGVIGFDSKSGVLLWGESTWPGIARAVLRRIECA